MEKRAGSTVRRGVATILCAAWMGAAAHAQTTTNVWTNTVTSGLAWISTNQWQPWTNYPDSVGAVAVITNNIGGGRTLYLTTNVTVGTLMLGDSDRGSEHDIRTTNAVPNVITFDNGANGVAALFEHGTGDRLSGNYGNGSGDMDVGVFVADADGLFIDNWQTFNFHNTYNTVPGRAFDGGGRNVTKGEDGYLGFRGIVTNIATFTQRDGFVEFYPDGDPRRLPGISNLVLGVAPGTIDGGANPDGSIVNVGETGAYDRIQFPYFSILGAGTTNGMAGTTNAMAITFNRGIFRSLARGVNGDVSNVAPPVYSGAVTLNGSANENFFIIEHQANALQSSHLTTIVRQTVFTAPFSGPGGFTKIGTGEMTFTTNNSFSGAVNITRGFDSGRGRYGGIGLRENGTFDSVSAITLNRDGELFLDNSAVNLSNRLNDAASITARGRSQIELVGNGSAASYERFGSVTGAQGSLAIEFDKIDATPQSQILEIASLVRTQGSVIGFHASDLQQGVFASTGPSNIVINLVDGGASLAQVGAGGGPGTTTRNLALGVFGGDGVDSVTNNFQGWMLMTPNRADEFMTVDAGRLRTLDPATEMAGLGGRVTNALFITQASAGATENVNINFASTQLELGTTALTNGLAQVIDKRVVGDAVFNAIRLGIVRGTNSVVQTGVPTDAGRSMIIADGVRLTSESGMLLAGRDTGSTNGDLSPNGNVLIYGGTLDLDGNANNREAILHNASGNSVFLRTSVEASKGLTKSGTENFYLDAANNLGGVVTIAQGSLYARDNNALRGASDIRTEGDGIFIMTSGVTITNITLHAGERPYGSPVLISEGNHNVFGGDISVENVDPQGIMHHDVRLRAAANSQTATLTLLGDIGIGEAVGTPDVNLTSSAIVGYQESGGILNLKGVFGDRLVDGQALPVDVAGTGHPRVDGGATTQTNRAATQNFVLRFTIDGNGGANQGDELNVNIYNQWNAAGRIYAQQGTVRYLGEGDFWTSNALTVANFANGLSGFQLGGGGTDAGGSSTFLLTKNGQAFNAERWTVATDNSANNTLTMGLEHFGASNATVTIGNNFNDPVDANGDDDRITISAASGTAGPIREFRLFAHDGYDASTGSNTVGRVNVIQSIVGNDFSMLSVVGNGTVALQGITNGARDEGNDIRLLNLMGGELILDRAGTDGQPTDVRRSSSNRTALFLSGGDLTHINGSVGTTELLTSNLTIRPGDSRVTIVAGSSGTSEMFLSTQAGAVTTRQRGGTVQFVEDVPGIALANIRLAGLPVGGRVGSWATYGTTYGGPATTWAATDAFSNLVAFTGFSTDGYGAGLHTDVTVGTNFAASVDTASARFSGGVGIDLGGNQFNVTEGGILIAPTVTGAAGISNGFLTSSGGELIIHNYDGAGGSFTIGAAITGAVDVTFSGDANGTYLTGNNTYAGITRINGGTVIVDSGARFGAATNLELRGGILATTASTIMTNRIIVLGGDGGTFQVAVNTTNAIANVISETNFLGATRQNNGHGDLIKTGAGTLLLGSNPGSTNEYIAAYNMHQGLTDIREGALVLTPTHQNATNSGYAALGSSKSFYDGTIVRSNASLVVNLSAAASGSAAAPMLYPNVTQTFNIGEWIMLEQGSTLRVNDPSTNAYQAQAFTGVIDFRGDATVFTQNDDTYFNNSGAGYLMGSGDLIKDGDGTLNIGENSPDYTGDLIIRDGTVRLYGPRNNPLPNAGSITIGVNDTTNRGTVGLMVWTDRDGTASQVEVNQNITVQGFNDGGRIGGYSMQHNDVVAFNGDIDLSNFATNGSTLEFRLYAEDQVESRAAGGADEFREEEFININGDITGGNKRIRTIVAQNYFSGLGYTQSREIIDGAQGTNEMNIMAFFTLAGSNTGWTGSLEVGNRAGTSVTTDGPDRDKQHFVRFGRNDGADTYAIGPSNIVILRNDATLQAYGSQVTIGSLFSDGIAANTTTDYFDNDGVTNAFLENGGTVAGTFRIVQASNTVFQGVVRDGTYYSPATTNLASAALNIIKAGSGILTFDRSNYYTGSTVIDEGILRVNGFHANGGQYTVNVGGTLGGTGVIDAAVLVQGGGTLAPGVGAGTLTIDGDLILTASAISAFDLNAGASNLVIAGAGLNDYVRGVDNLVLDGGLNVTWSSLDVTNATEGSYWTLFQYDTSLSNLYLDINTLPALADPTLSWGVDTFSVLGEVRLAVVPEPYTWLLVLFGLGLFAARFRRP